MLVNRQNWSEHRFWVYLIIVATLLSIAWFGVASIGQSAWPGGSSAPGLTFGVVGGLIIVFECLLWWRKHVRTWRIGRTQVWLRAHIWLGLLTLPLLVLHSGLRFGGLLSTVLLLLLVVVVASGVFGLVLQQLVPKQMFEEVPAETIYGQIDHVAALMRQDSYRLVLSTCGPREGEEAELEETEGDGAAPQPYRTVGAVRSVGRVQGRVLETVVPSAPVPEAEPLRQFFHDMVEPFLTEAPGSSPLRSPSQAAVMFRDLRTKLRPAAHPTVDMLEGVCDQRRQLEKQRSLHFWLHSWLCIHLPLSIALLVLMFVHVWVALKYW